MNRPFASTVSQWNSASCFLFTLGHQQKKRVEPKYTEEHQMQKPYTISMTFSMFFSDISVSSGGAVPSVPVSPSSAGFC